MSAPVRAIRDNAGSSLTDYYAKGKDYYITIEGNCTEDTTGLLNVLCLIIDDNSLDIAPEDTLYFYDGPDPSYPLLWKGNNNSLPLDRVTFYMQRTNTTGKLCVRFRTSLNSSGDHLGFLVTVECGNPCEKITPVVDSVYDRIDLRNGMVLGTGKMRMVPESVDTIFLEVAPGVYDSTQIVGFDTASYILGALLCMGHGVRFHGHGEYTHNAGWYNFADENLVFRWNLGGDTIVQQGATQPRYDGFQSTSC